MLVGEYLADNRRVAAEGCETAAPGRLLIVIFFLILILRAGD
jgi:hypothetical protein